MLYSIGNECFEEIYIQGTLFEDDADDPNNLEQQMQ